jgi:plasmid stabilization system protein ParE
MTLQWSDHAVKTFQEASDYIACNFYPDYADAFDADVLETSEKLLENPLLGKIVIRLTLIQRRLSYARRFSYVRASSPALL